jgi:7,8-dihydro-6-hydroxymethylpterin-pyrophosphokinase
MLNCNYQRAFIAVGSNLGNRVANIARAVKEIQANDVGTRRSGALGVGRWNLMQFSQAW